MNPDARAHLRLVTLIGVAGIVALLSGGVAWTSIAFPTPIPLPTVRVTSATWQVEGCAVSNVTGPGGVANGAVPLRLTAVLENTATSASCLLESVSVESAGFEVENSTLPVTLGPVGTSTDAAAVTLNVTVPRNTESTTLSVVVAGTREG